MAPRSMAEYRVETLRGSGERLCMSLPERPGSRAVPVVNPARRGRWREVCAAPALAAGLLLLAPLPARALDPAAAIGGYSLRSWTFRDGLPASRVEALDQSPDGYLWIATLSGLVRFDGVRFVSARADATVGVMASRSGELRIVSRGHELFRQGLANACQGADIKGIGALSVVVSGPVVSGLSAGVW